MRLRRRPRPRHRDLTVPDAPEPDGDARRIIDELGLTPHPEGGWYVRTWRHEPPDGGRGAGSAIYYLLTGDGRSRWHRVDATEIWHHYAGAALELRIVPSGGSVHRVVLGPDLPTGQRPQVVVPPRAWQSGRSLGDHTLAGTTVCPAFEFAGFELAPDGWEPPGQPLPN